MLVPLAVLLSNLASAQYTHRYKAFPDTLQSLIPRDTVLTFYPDYQSKNTDELFERLKMYDEQREKMKIAANRKHMGMPVVTPQGFHHLRVYPPDPSVDYSLIIVPKPEKLQQVPGDVPDGD